MIHQGAAPFSDFACYRMTSITCFVNARSRALSFLLLKFGRCDFSKLIFHKVV